MGSMFVMPNVYDTSDPTADPRPGPTSMPCDFDMLIKSHTIKKYPEKLSFLIISNSYSNRCFNSGVMCSYRFFNPSRHLNAR